MAGISLIAATVAAAAAPRLAGGGTVDVSIVRVVSALVLSLLVAAAAVVVLRRGNGRFDLSRLRLASGAVSGRRIMPVETRRISAHADVCLFRCDGVDYLVLCSATRQQVLRQSPAAAEAGL